MNVTKSLPISFCSGVTKAILSAQNIRKKYPDKRIYFLGNLVHNKRVIDDFKSENINILEINNDNYIEIINALNNDDIVIFSAHGHNKSIENLLQKKGILFFDTTCDKVSKINKKIQDSNKEIIYIGKLGHPECIASLSYSNHIYLYDINSKFDYSKLKTDNPLVLNQSTLSILELENIFKDIKNNVKNPEFSDEICDATRIRQEKLINLKNIYDLVVIVGDKNSSNSTKLFEIASANKLHKSIMVNSIDELKEYDLSNYKNAFLTSGTSAPLDLILEIEAYLKEI